MQDRRVKLACLRSKPAVYISTGLLGPFLRSGKRAPLVLNQAYFFFAAGLRTAFLAVLFAVFLTTLARTVFFTAFFAAFLAGFFAAFFAGFFTAFFTAFLAAFFAGFFAAAFFVAFFIAISRLSSSSVGSCCPVKACRNASHSKSLFVACLRLFTCRRVRSSERSLST